MTIPDPTPPAVSPDGPEVRRSPDGRLIAYCRSARHGLWRKSDGYDCDPEDVADWTLLVPAVSPVDTAALRARIATALERLPLGFISPNGSGSLDVDYAAAAEIAVEGITPLLSAAAHREGQALVRQNVLRADLGEAQREIERLTAERDAYRESYRQAQSNWRGAVAANVTALETIAELKRELAGARPIPDDAAERVSARRLPEVHASPNCACGFNLAGTAFVDPLCEKFLDGNRHGAAPTTDPAPAAADVQWGVQRADGVLDQMDDEDDARRHLNWFDDGTAQVVNRTVAYGSWTPAPAAPQAPAEPTANPHGLIDATHVVNLHRSTRCTGCNAADQFWCSCPDGYAPPDDPAAREDTAPPDNDGYNSDLTAGFLRSRPPCANDLGDIHPSEPGYVINDEPYCRECFDSCGPFDDEKFAPPEGEKP